MIRWRVGLRSLQLKPLERSDGGPSLSIFVKRFLNRARIRKSHRQRIAFATGKQNVMLGQPCPGLGRQGGEHAGERTLKATRVLHSDPRGAGCLSGLRTRNHCPGTDGCRCAFKTAFASSLKDEPCLDGLARQKKLSVSGSGS